MSLVICTYAISTGNPDLWGESKLEEALASFRNRGVHRYSHMGWGVFKWMLHNQTQTALSQ